MKNRKKKIFLILILTLFMLLGFTGCKKEANVISKFTADTISLYSDKMCTVNLKIDIQEGNTVQTINKKVNCYENKTIEISKEDLADGYFKNDSEIVGLKVGETEKSESEIFLTIVAIVIACLILFLIITIFI